LEEPDHDVTRSDHLVHNRGSRTVKATEPTPREDTDKGNLGSKNRSSKPLRNSRRFWNHRLIIYYGRVIVSE
ncbi:hypothetical protein ADUPG1_002189, partial [Aduncisulcus paluster]